MSIADKAARFLVEHVAKNALAAAGTQIGEAIGKRIGARIYTPPAEPEKPNPGDGKAAKP
jgi:hypothetical protein